nr:hypothetical protein [Actinomycetota bacterium]
PGVVAEVPDNKRWSRSAVAALVALALAGALASAGTIGERDGDEGWGDLWPVLLIIAGATLVVFAFLVPRTIVNRRNAGIAGLALSALAVAAVVVFWTGLPPILAIGGVVLGHEAWRRTEPGEGRVLATGALVLGAGALVAYVIAALADQS